MSKLIRSHFDLDVYGKALAVAMKVFEVTKAFPKHELYSLVDQVRRSSRSVCANLAEAWRKRRYPNHFVSKLTDAEGEAAETQTWVQFAVKCEYLTREVGVELHQGCEETIKMIVAMIRNPERWTLQDK